MPKVILAPTLSRWLPGAPPGERAFAVTADTVRQAIEQLLQTAPQLRGYILDDQGALRHHVAAFVDGVVVCDKQSLLEAVPPEGEVYLVQALSGG